MRQSKKARSPRRVRLARNGIAAVQKTVSVRELKVYEESAVHRLVSCLNHFLAEEQPYHPNPDLMPDIANVLDLFIQNGPCSQVQAAFNSLAARHRHYGRVALRVAVKLKNETALSKEMHKLVRKLSAEETDHIQRVRLTEPDNVTHLLLKQHPEAKEGLLRAMSPRLVGKVINPVFDLFLTLLDPTLIGRVRRCKAPACGRYLIAIPGKKEYCSGRCRNRFWSREMRRTSGHDMTKRNGKS